MPRFIPASIRLFVRAPTQDDSDADLLARCKRGEQPPLVILMSRYAGILHALAVNHGVDDEEDTKDLIQDTWLLLVEKDFRIQDEARLRGYLCGVLIRKIFALRRKRHQVVSVDEAQDIEREAERFERAYDLRRAIERLEGDERTVIVLMLESDSITPAQIARLTGLGVGDVYRVRKHSFQKLRTLLEEMNGDKKYEQ